MLRDPDLPDALHEMEGDVSPSYARSQEARQERLDALGLVIAAKRDDAVKARKESGIEAIWTASEEAYMGIDDVNRAEFAGSRWAKPTSSAGPLTADKATKNYKSTVFVPLTARYVDMAFAKTSEMTLPIDDKGFAIKPMPIPDLVKQIADTSPAMTQDGGQIMNPQGQPATRGQLLQAQYEAATAAARKEETWVENNLKKSKHPTQMRKLIFDAARLGTGVIKGPIPTVKRTQAFSIEGNKGKLTIVEKIAPGTEWMDVWNLFPARGCGEDIHSGEYLCDREFYTQRRLKDLKKLKDQFGSPLYIPHQIDKAIEQGPGKVNQEAQAGNTPTKKDDHKNHFEVFRFYGVLNIEDMKAMGAQGVEDLPDDVFDVHAVVELVNDVVIRASINPLESGRYPHKVVVWQRRSGYWAGIGVGERVEVPQKIMNGGARAMLNNAGKSGGSQIVVRRSVISPADGSWDLNTGDKIWYMDEDTLVDDVRKIFMNYQIPNLTPQMLTIIEFAQKLAEQLTNIPLATQGQTGKDDPETFGQAELNDNNAHALLRSIAANIDDNCTEPLVQDFHEWYLLDPEIPDEDKGEFEIDAMGSVATVERAIQEQTFAQLLELTKDPVWGQDPKKVFARFMKAKRLNPEETAYSPDELAKITSAPPPPTPQEKVATINAAAKLHVTEMQIQAHEQEGAAPGPAGTTAPHEAAAAAKIHDSVVRSETAKYVEDSRASAEAARAEKELEIARTDGEYKMRLAEMQRDILLLEYAQRQQLTLTQVKGQLANTALQLRAKHELTGAQQQFQQTENQVDRNHEVAQNEVDRQHEQQQNEQQREHEMEQHTTQLEADQKAAKLQADAAKAAAKAKPKPAAKKPAAKGKK